MTYACDKLSNLLTPLNVAYGAFKMSIIHWVMSLMVWTSSQRLLPLAHPNYVSLWLFSAPYLCLLVCPLLCHLLESLQHPAKVGDTEVETNLFIVLPRSTEKQLTELGVNFAFFFWRELFFSGSDHSTKAEKVKGCQGFTFSHHREYFLSLAPGSRFLKHWSEILSPLIICQRKSRFVVNGKKKKNMDHFWQKDINKDNYVQHCSDVKTNISRCGWRMIRVFSASCTCLPLLQISWVKKENGTNTQNNNEWAVSMGLHSTLTGGSLTSSHIEISSANSLSILIGSKAFVGVCLVLVYIDNLWKGYYCICIKSGLISSLN